MKDKEPPAPGTHSGLKPQTPSVLFPELPRRAPRVASLYTHPEILATDMSGCDNWPPKDLGGGRRYHLRTTLAQDPPGRAPRPAGTGGTLSGRFETDSKRAQRRGMWPPAPR